MSDTLQPVRLNVRNLGKSFEPESSINLRDPETDALTGVVMTHSEVQAVLYSLYRDLIEGTS